VCGRLTVLHELLSEDKKRQFLSSSFWNKGLHSCSSVCTLKRPVFPLAMCLQPRLG